MGGGIQFNAGQSMNVEKIFKVNVKDEKKALEVLRNTVAGCGDPQFAEDNSDYVIFKKDDTLHIAVGVGKLEGVEKNVDLGLDDDVKFKLDGKEYTAIQVIDKMNTKAEVKDYSSVDIEGKIRLTTVGSVAGGLLGAALTKNMSKGFAIGAILAATLTNGSIAISDKIEKNAMLKAPHPGLDDLAKRGFLTEVK